MQLTEKPGIDAEVRQCQEHESVTGWGVVENIQLYIGGKDKIKNKKTLAKNLDWVFLP